VGPPGVDGVRLQLLLALGLLIGFTNTRVRAMFVTSGGAEPLALPARQVVERVLASGGAALEPVQRE